MTASDFRAPDTDSAADAAAMAERSGPNYRIEPARDGATRFTVLEGAPELEAVDPAPVQAGADPVMMDSLVGDINGTPVYASSFFSVPIEARLRGLAAKVRNDEGEWRSEARMIIGGVVYDEERDRTLFVGQLGGMVRDELLLADARASLTPEQKQGLLSFIEQVRKDLVSRGGGGQAAVDQSLRESEGGGLEEKLKQNIDRQLIAANLREKILPRANVSWHEVEVEYERRAEKFNPNPTAYFRIIQLPTKEAALVEEFKSALAAGTPFAELAERPENEGPHEVQERPIKGEYSEAALFAPKELNRAAQMLQPGGTTEPVSFGSWTAWVHLERIDVPRSKSIYEAQLEIYNQLREAKLDAETDRYLAQLLDKDAIGKFAEMNQKLVDIAVKRYFRPVQ